MVDFLYFWKARWIQPLSLSLSLSLFIYLSISETEGHLSWLNDMQRERQRGLENNHLSVLVTEWKVTDVMNYDAYPILYAMDLTD